MGIYLYYIQSCQSCHFFNASNHILTRFRHIIHKTALPAQHAPFSAASAIACRLFSIFFSTLPEFDICIIASLMLNILLTSFYSKIRYFFLSAEVRFFPLSKKMNSELPLHDFCRYKRQLPVFYLLTVYLKETFSIIT